MLGLNFGELNFLNLVYEKDGELSENRKVKKQHQGELFNEK